MRIYHSYFNPDPLHLVMKPKSNGLFLAGMIDDQIMLVVIPLMPQEPENLFGNEDADSNDAGSAVVQETWIQQIQIDIYFEPH